jgi:hypothetical protein
VKTAWFTKCLTFPFFVVFVVAGCIVYVSAVVVFFVVFCVLCFVYCVLLECVLNSCNVCCLLCPIVVLLPPG